MKGGNPKVLLLSLLFLFIAQANYAQKEEKHTISGYVKDAASAENLFGATVYIQETDKGVAANQYGFYSITVPPGKYTLVVSYLGYNDIVKAIDVSQDIRINIDLEEAAYQSEEVEIVAERADKNVQSTDMGRIELPTEEVKMMPALLGEVDVLKTIQLLPGIQASGEGNSGFYVRGGGPDQNLILLDNAVVYNTGHLFGFFSIFNSDAIKNTTVIKGGMPANYGGRISSVIDVGLKEGHMKEFHGEGGLGLISSRITLQGPIKKEKASFLISGRRTYADLLARPVLKRYKGGEFFGNSYYFYDVSMKLNYKFSDKDRLYASSYIGDDEFNFKSGDDAFQFNFPWGNRTATIRWNHLFSDKLFMNVTGLFNKYRFAVSSEFQDVTFQLNSGVQDWGAKVDFDFYPEMGHKMKFGADYKYHIFTPYQAEGNTGSFDFSTANVQKKFAHEAAIYATDEFDIGRRLSINVGLRASMFSNVGPGDKIQFDELGRAIDTLSFGKGEAIATYGALEPRFSARYSINQNSSVKLGLTYNQQYIHMVSSSTTTLPTDLWVPSTDKVKPQRGLLYAIGYFRNFLDNMLETSVEFYYKDLRNQIEFGESYAIELNDDIENGFVFGKGYSTGVEFFVKKTRGKWSGWIGYTLSFTRRNFEELNEGNIFPARYDRTHDLSLVAMYKINEKWRISSTFVYATGQTTTIPINWYFIEGRIVNEYGERNAYRLAPYHRLDFGAIYTMKTKERYVSELAISVYNIYNRANPFFIYYEIGGDLSTQDLEVSAKQVSLFPILPSVTWNFKF